ncbi:MAG: rhodanese-like domain-containing protein [Saprospiraceae bacterium]|nr:rhodanese-like domain-containing protein [Saprospiraceae bacterium]
MTWSVSEAEISYQTLLSWQREHRPLLLVDVREAFEREAGHIGGLWIPLGELPSRLPEIDQGVPIVFYCRKGVRSLIAIQRLHHRLPGTPLYSLKKGLQSLMLND